MTKTLLLTGATGLLGRAIRAEFARDDAWNCIATGFSRYVPRYNIMEAYLKRSNCICNLLCFYFY